MFEDVAGEELVVVALLCCACCAENEDALTGSPDRPTYATERLEESVRYPSKLHTSASILCMTGTFFGDDFLVSSHDDHEAPVTVVRRIIFRPKKVYRSF
jgi:hypothetical protein